MMLRLLILASLLAIAPHAHAQVSPDDARHTLEVLQDPQKRDQLVSTLKTIAQAQTAARAQTDRPDRSREPRRRGAGWCVQLPQSPLRRGNRHPRRDPERAAAVGMAAHHGDRAVGARHPAGHRVATRRCPGAEPRRGLGDAARGGAPDPGAGAPGAQRRRADPRGCRSPRRARRNRAAPPATAGGADVVAARAAYAWPLRPGTAAGPRLPGRRSSARRHLARRQGPAPPCAARGHRRLRALRRHPLRRAGHVLAHTAAPSHADDDRQCGRLRHALDQPHRGDQRVRLCGDRGGIAARPLGHRA